MYHCVKLTLIYNFTLISYLNVTENGTQISCKILHTFARLCNLL